MLCAAYTAASLSGYTVARVAAHSRIRIRMITEGHTLRKAVVPVIMIILPLCWRWFDFLALPCEHTCLIVILNICHQAYQHLFRENGITDVL